MTTDLTFYPASEKFIQSVYMPWKINFWKQNECWSWTHALNLIFYLLFLFFFLSLFLYLSVFPYLSLSHSLSLTLSLSFPPYLCLSRAVCVLGQFYDLTQFEFAFGVTRLRCLNLSTLDLHLSLNLFLNWTRKKYWRIQENKDKELVESRGKYQYNMAILKICLSELTVPENIF